MKLLAYFCTVAHVILSYLTLSHLISSHTLHHSTGVSFYTFHWTDPFDSPLFATLKNKQLIYSLAVTSNSIMWVSPLRKVQGVLGHPLILNAWTLAELPKNVKSVNVFKCRRSLRFPYYIEIIAFTYRNSENWGWPKHK